MTERSKSESRPPTVLMTADCVGGVWSYAVGLCRSLPDTRFIFATMGPRALQAQRAAIYELENVILEESDYRLEWMAGGNNDFYASRRWLLDLIARYEVDVVHVNGYAHGQVGPGRPVIVVAHSDVLTWWEAVHKCPAPPEWDEYRRNVTAGLAAASRIIAPTAAVINDLERHYLSLTNAPSVIPNGVDPAAFPITAKQPAVLAAGRLWDAAKNLVSLSVVASGLEWPVTIAGEFEHPEGGTVRLPNVRLLGRLTPPQMTCALASAGIFAAPARYEPFGLSILEAAAARCPLVLGDIRSLRENWNGAAIFVDPERPTELQAALAMLIANPHERERLAAAARRRARSLTMDRMATAYSSLYLEIMQSSAPLETA